MHFYSQIVSNFSEESGDKILEFLLPFSVIFFLHFYIIQSHEN